MIIKSINNYTLNSNQHTQNKLQISIETLILLK